MKLLLLSDKESPYLWDYYQPGRLDGIDLILSCGDLKSNYLSFLVTMGRAPLLYVHGNHDTLYSKYPLRGATALRTSWSSSTASEFWDWAAAPSTAEAPTSTPSGRCAGAFGSRSWPSAGLAGWTSC